MNRRLVTVVLAMVAVLPGALAAQPARARAFVLDQQARTLTALSVPGGRVEQTATLLGTPAFMRRTDDGQRLLVFDRGEGRDAGEAGYQARTRSAVTIVDGRTLAVLGRVELGWGLDRAVMLSARGDRVSVLCPGFSAKKPTETLARELVTVDLVGRTVVSRVELPRRATAAIATPDGRTAIVLSAREQPKKAPVVPAELRFIDLAAGSIAATVALEGDPGGPVLAPDGQFLFLLDRGKPNDNPDKNINGRLHAVSMASRAVQVTDVGSDPSGLVLDERGRQLLLLSKSNPVKPATFARPGELRVIRGGTPSAPITVGALPFQLDVSPDGGTLYVKGADSLTRVSLPGLTPTPPVLFPFMTSEMVVSPDGRRAYALGGEDFTTVDAVTGQKIESVRTGRMGKKMFLALQVGLKTAASKSEGERKAQKEGKSYYQYTEYSLRDPIGSMSIRPDGKAVYALNSQTSDVTIVDAASGAVLEKVAAGGFAVRFMPAGGVALVVSSDTVHAVDLTTHQKRPDLVAGSAADFDEAELSPDASLAVISGSGGVLLVEAAGGKAVGTMKVFSRVAGVIVDWGHAAR
jgi:DNA-binding beta-propeller fold protein YncE